MSLNIVSCLTHCDTDDGVAGRRVEVVRRPGNVVVMEQRHHVGQGGEGDVSHAVGLLDVNYHLSYLIQKKRDLRTPDSAVCERRRHERDD